jgi:hypothetical protein
MIDSTTIYAMSELIGFYSVLAVLNAFGICLQTIDRGLMSL